MNFGLITTLTLLWTATESGGSWTPDGLWRSVQCNKTGIPVQGLQRVLQNETEVDLSDVLPERKLLSTRLLSLLPPFAATSSVINNQQCRDQSKTFLHHLSRLRLWALKMHDASGKLPAGILNGNVNQFGDFDLCLNVEEPTEDIRGKYCLAYLQIKVTPDAPDSEVLQQIFDLMQSHSAFISKLSDPGHRVPRFSTINWGLCVPHSCTAEDVELQLKDIVHRHSNSTGFDVEVLVEPEMCQIKKPWRFSASFIFVSWLLLSIVALSALATVKEIIKGRDDSILNCFSLKRNLWQLFDFSRPADDIESVHSIRCINAIMLIISHKSMALFFNPYTNRTYMAENLGQPWSVVARAASLYTDPFIMISGVLTSYSFFRTLRANKTLNLKKEYFNRLIRIVPMLAVVVLVCTFMLPELGSGPQWNLTVSHHAEKCKSTWWRNFLFIHNYFGFENMCLTHTHHLGIDTQLFAISPFLVLLLHKWPLPGLSTLIALAAASTALRYQVTMTKGLSYFIYSGSSIKQMFDTANYSYVIPSHRLTVYIMGILLGYVLQYCGRDYKMKPHMRRLGWTVAISLFYYSYIKPSYMGRHGYIYDRFDAALYGALAPIGWCLFFAWIIFVSHIGYGGWFGQVLSSRYFMLWTRVSYAVYLSQFPVFFFNIGMQRTAQHYSILLFIDFLEYLAIAAATVALTLFFDFPFNNMKKLLLRK